MIYSSDDSMSQFYRVTLSCSPIAKDLFSHMTTCMKSLKKIDDEITLKIDHIKERLTNAIHFFPSKFERSRYTHKVCFIIHKYLNLFLKYQSLQFSHLCQIQKSINEFKNLISDYLKQNVPIQIEFSDFLSSVFDKVNEKIPKLEFKLEALFNYAKNLQNIEKNPIITNNEILDEIKKLSLEVDTKNDYIHPNHFDMMFEIYIESNPELKSNILQVINFNEDIPQPDQDDNDKRCLPFNYKLNDYKRPPVDFILNNYCYLTNMFFCKINQKSKDNAKINFKLNQDSRSDDEIEEESSQGAFNIKYLSSLLESTFISLTGSSKIDYKMLAVLYCAMFRYLCNKYYIIHSDEWFEKNNDDYFQNCQKIINQTPRDMEMSSEIIPESLYDTSFSVLLLGDYFQDSIKKMLSIQFLLCPIDIWTELQMSINMALKGANHLTGTDGNRFNVSFDDFFSIILPVYASAQIMSPKALHNFLLHFKSLPKSNSFDSTAISAVALSGYLRNEIY